MNAEMKTTVNDLADIISLFVTVSPEQKSEVYANLVALWRKLGEQVTTLENDLATSEAKRKELATLNEAKSQEIEKYGRKFADLESRKKANLETIRRLNELMEGRDFLNRALVAYIGDLEDKLSVATAKLAETSEKLRCKTDVYERLRKQYAELTEHSADIRALHTKDMKQIAVLTADIQELRHKVEALGIEKTGLATLVQLRDSQIHDLEKVLRLEQQKTHTTHVVMVGGLSTTQTLNGGKR